MNVKDNFQILNKSVNEFKELYNEYKKQNKIDELEVYEKINYIPSNFGIFWGELPLDTDKRHKIQNTEKYNCYNKSLKKKNIIETLDLLINLISEKVKELSI